MCVAKCMSTYPTPWQFSSNSPKTGQLSTKDILTCTKRLFSMNVLWSLDISWSMKTLIILRDCFKYYVLCTYHLSRPKLVYHLSGPKLVSEKAPTMEPLEVHDIPCSVYVAQMQREKFNNWHICQVKSV